MCSGVITSELKSDYTYEVSVYHSPIGKFHGPIYAKSAYDPGSDGNLKKGSSVQLIMSFQFGGAENKFIDYDHNMAAYILGTFNERTIDDLDIDAPNSNNDPSRTRWLNSRSGAGIIADDSGKVLTTSGGAIHSILSPYGHGSNQHLKSDHAQNHKRVISHNKGYLTREHFGLFEGSDEDDKLERTFIDDYPINFRRFVTQTKNPTKWVSQCHGAWQPWLGPNNSVTDYGDIGKEVLYTNIVNYEDSRATLEAGEPGDTFINFRIDRVIKGESRMPIGSGAGPAVLGNRFKLSINEEGELDIRAAGKGTPGANTNNFHMSVDASGNLTIHAAGELRFSHGDSDQNISSIVMSPSKGIDIINKNGLRINGKTLVNEDFLKWMQEYQTRLCLVTSIGGPAPINPEALPSLIKGISVTDDLGGFTTKNKGIPATGLITDNDTFDTV